MKPNLLTIYFFFGFKNQFSGMNKKNATKKKNVLPINKFYTSNRNQPPLNTMLQPLLKQTGGGLIFVTTKKIKIK